MTSAVMIKRLAQVSPQSTARIVGGLYFFTLVSSQLLETFLGDKVVFDSGLIEVMGMATVTLLLYFLFKPVNQALALVSLLLNLAGIVFEALRLNPQGPANDQGANTAMLLHGLFCLLIGYLIFRSTFLPRFLGALIAIGGLSWLTFPLTPFASYLSPTNVVCGLVGEALFFLWLTIAGVNAERWREQADA